MTTSKSKRCPKCAASGMDKHEDNFKKGDSVWHCFSCGHEERHYEGGDGDETPRDKQPKEQTPKQVLPTKTADITSKWRGISPATFRKFGVYRAKQSGGREIVIYPYADHSWKARGYTEKFFTSSEGTKELPLFGMAAAAATANLRSITITEGENDALAIAEMDPKGAVVSIQGSSTALRDCKAAYEWLMRYDKIKLCFDNDEAGRAALAEVLPLFPTYKVCVIKLDRFKDANEYLEKGAAKDFMSLWWRAEPKKPENVISTRSEIEAVFKRKDVKSICSYPLPTLERKLMGYRPGELVVWTAETSNGKTEFMRAIEHHHLKTVPDVGIGILHFEENDRRVLDGLITYELGKPCHLPRIVEVSVEDKMKAWDDLIGTEGRPDRCVIYDSFGGDSIDSVLNMLRYMVVAQGCEVIVLDHISMLVTGQADIDERRTLDVLSTKLAVLCAELSFCLHCVSHVNDEGRTRGSRNIEKVAHTIIHIDRDKEAEDENERNTSHLMVKKCRYTGDTGPGGDILFDKDTYKLREVMPDTEPDDEVVETFFEGEGR